MSAPCRSGGADMVAWRPRTGPPDRSSQLNL